ncbi:MAG TPA: c-type cytochrome [Bryobacteraceae bacterium]|nr:c-type cytochrome [Bryobacteraceae bacterium]
MRNRAKLLILAAACATLAAGFQHGSSTNVNPATGPVHEAAGAKLYRSQCAGCHGIDGAGTGAGPNLSTGEFRHGASDEALFLTITKGVPGSAMPAFQLDGQRTWQLVTYLRALSVRSGAAQVKGDAQNGARLFETAGCKQCHTVGADGGFIGPDLRAATAGQSVPALRSALLEPGASVAPQHWRVSVRLSSGGVLEGTRLNEDTHSIQLRNREGKLISINRADVAEARILRESPMPSYAKRLSEAEVNDILAWMIGLRGAK